MICELPQLNSQEFKFWLPNSSPIASCKGSLISTPKAFQVVPTLQSNYRQFPLYTFPTPYSNSSPVKQSYGRRLLRRGSLVTKE